MAKLIHLTSGSYAVRGDFGQIGLGKVTKRQAESARVRIEELARCRDAGGGLSPSAAEYVAKVSPAMRKKLADKGLIDTPDKPSMPTVAQWVRRYIEGRTDVKGATAITYAKRSAEPAGVLRCRQAAVGRHSARRPAVQNAPCHVDGRRRGGAVREHGPEALQYRQAVLRRGEAGPADRRQPIRRLALCRTGEQGAVLLRDA